MNHAEQMRRLLAEHDRQERAVAAAYADGYRDGFTFGRDVGYGRAAEEMAAEWSTVAGLVRTHGRGEPYANQEQRRNTPGGPAYIARLARHGTEYTGGPVDWETGRPIRRVA